MRFHETETWIGGNWDSLQFPWPLQLKHFSNTKSCILWLQRQLHREPPQRDAYEVKTHEQGNGPSGWRVLCQSWSRKTMISKPEHSKARVWRLISTGCPVLCVHDKNNRIKHPQSLLSSTDTVRLSVAANSTIAWMYTTSSLGLPGRSRYCTKPCLFFQRMCIGMVFFFTIASVYKWGKNNPTMEGRSFEAQSHRARWPHRKHPRGFGNLKKPRPWKESRSKMDELRKIIFRSWQGDRSLSWSIRTSNSATSNVQCWDWPICWTLKTKAAN